MTKDLARKCSHCGHNGHNCRTCHGKGRIKLFGVRIDIKAPSEKLEDEQEKEFIRKSKSMGNLQSCRAEHNNPPLDDAGSLSDGLIQSDRAHERKKGVPWTEDEHRSFLIGLEKLGKGDWRGISKNYVPTRTPTQVASHAQKYFIRMFATEKKKRRSSLFDIPLKESTSPPSPPPPPPQASSALLFNIPSEFSQEGSTSTHVAASEKPPLSPMAATYVPDPFHIPYMVGVPSKGHSFPAADIVPAVSFLRMMSFPNSGYIYLPNSYGNLATCAPFMNQTSNGLFPQPLPHEPSSQAGAATSVTKKGGLEASIGALSI